MLSVSVSVFSRRDCCELVIGHFAYKDRVDANGHVGFFLHFLIEEASVSTASINLTIHCSNKPQPRR